MRFRWQWILVLFCLMTLSMIEIGCSNPAGSSSRERRGQSRVQFPVETIPIKARHVVYQVIAVGSVEAFEEVQVTARVAGVVERIYLVEGETVEKDKVLAEIEPERYRLAVESAEAAVKKAGAAKVDAEAALSRREAANLKNPRLIIWEEIETWRTRVQTATAEMS